MLASSNSVSELPLRDECLAQADLSLHECNPLAASPGSDGSCAQQHPLIDGATDECAGNFDCHVCAQACGDPVVTMCGHLFCWPCLYHCLSLHSTSQECPVCRADVRDKIVPLYGCGRLSSSTGKMGGMRIPSRPSVGAHSDNHRSKRNYAIQQNGAHTGSSAHLAFCALLRRFGLTSLAPQDGGFLSRCVHGAASHLMRRRRFNNEKEFALHWVFIIAASATIPFFLAC